MNYPIEKEENGNPQPDLREKELIRQAQSDPVAFTELYDRYAQRVYRYLLSKTGFVQDAEDLTTQTFMAALQAIGGYKHRNNFSAWLFTIARNKAIDHFRTQGKQVSFEEVKVNSENDWRTTGLQHDQEIDLAAVISNLPEEDQELLRLRFVAQMRFRDIATFLGKREGAVKRKIYRLLAWMEKQLEDYHE